MKASDIDTATEFAEINGQHAGHRGPFAAGGADRYYGRRYRPNFTYNGVTFNEDEMTPEQRAEYEKGWSEETERKDWGN